MQVPSIVKHVGWGEAMWKREGAKNIHNTHPPKKNNPKKPHNFFYNFFYASHTTGEEGIASGSFCR